MSSSSPIIHRGFEDFSLGSFDNGGDNLYVNSRGEIEIIHRFDVNGDGHVDLILPNAHGYDERGPTTIYKQKSNGEWDSETLPNDSGYMSRILDVDGDGFPDLIVVNGANGVTSELDSYIYWGGPDGLTGERTELPTAGAYEVVATDLNGNGHLDLIFPSAWLDHHNPGISRLLQVYTQIAHRRFEDQSTQYGLTGIAARTIAGADLNHNGKLDLVVANFREGFQFDIDSYVYWGKEGGFDTESPLKLPSHAAMEVTVGDLNNDGWSDILFAGGGQIWIYWNREGHFDEKNRTILDFSAESTEFRVGAVVAHIADVDGDGRNELLVAADDGIYIHSQDDLTKAIAHLPLPACTWIETADLNVNGHLDIIASRFHDGKTYDCDSVVFWNSADGFSKDRVTLLETAGAMGCVAGDLDGDGIPEIVFNSTHSGWLIGNPDFPLYVYLGNEEHEYSTDRRLDLPVGHTNVFALADLDQSGYPDLVCTTKSGMRIFNGSSKGLDPSLYYDLPERSPGLYNVLIADLNHDGWLDLVGIPMSLDYKPETLAHSSVIYYGSPDGFTRENMQPLPTSCRGAGILADVNRNGWIDIICPDIRGYIGIFLGGPSGYSPDRMLKIPLEGIDVTFVPAVTCADLNGDGWLDIIVTFMGHYTRERSGFFILYGSSEGYSTERTEFHPTDASSILISAADLNNNGHLDLLVPAYSTEDSRVIPAHIFWGDGKSFDFENPLSIPCDASCAFMAIDITQNGYKDLLTICHRNDVGHRVDSLLFWNGPDGLDLDNPVKLPGLGPHLSCSRDFGNAFTREPIEHFASAPIELQGNRPTKLSWEGETPFNTEFQFELRWAQRKDDLESQNWSGPSEQEPFYLKSGSDITGVAPDAAWLQYRVGFVSPNGCGSPKLTEVRIDCLEN